ncbi:MAG: hypothetical protein O3C20_09270 [Verrucomicrobia bacterium]|nr:hypothetical protein [Verrucomicrobiota bacterium]
MIAHFKKTFIVGACLLIVSAVWASAKENRVAVKSIATPEFSKTRAGSGSKKIQTYHVTQGKYFGGNTADKSMDGVTFMDIAENLAANLKRQGFYSEPDDDKGDLLIVINYGATDYDADYQELMGIDSLDDLGFGVSSEEGLDEFEAADAFAADFENIQAMNEAGQMDKIYKAKLLGMEELFNDSATTQQVFEFEDMVNEERYFIYLIAFDLPSYRKGEKKVMWTTRYSMRAIGQPFDEAIAELNTVASHFFGMNMKGMQNRRASDEFEVQMGDIEVISDDDPEPAN